jgi:DNA-3-methyladenine glycosylase
VTPHRRSRAPARGRTPAGALSHVWYARPAEQVARDLLGAVLVSTVDDVETSGRIVETEAYVGPHDEASHAAARVGRTRRNDAMFGEPGTAYVYRIYGMHWCLNVVTDEPGFPAAVLIRAIQPIAGIDVMRRRRQRSQKPLAERALTSGPGRLAQALGIAGGLNGHALDLPPLVLLAHDGDVPDDAVARGPRIGITRAADWPLRFWERNNPWVSR